MRATDILMEEHRVIERVLTAMEQEITRVEAGKPVRTGFFIDTAEFIKGFADGCHHKKEEGALFKATPPEMAAPVRAMLADHEQARKYTRAMLEAAQRMEEGVESEKIPMLDAARGYVTLLRQHIAKEDTVFFPMAGRLISPEKQAQLVTDFDYIEHEETGAGVHEKYEAMADMLERQAAM